MAVFTNLFTNPQPVSSTGWGTTAGASGVTTPSVITNAAGPAGNQARRVTWTTGTATALAGQWCGGGTGTAQNVPATPGSAYSAGGYVRSSKAQRMVARIQWLDAANAQLSVSTGADVVVAANTWTEIKLENVIAPAGAVSVRANFYSAASTVSPWAAGDTLDVQAGTPIQGAVLPQPFHGAMADTATIDYAWLGTPDASGSTRTDVTNVAPIANAGPDQTVEPWTTVTLTGAASTDSDGTVASYNWTQTAGPAVTLSGTGATRTFTAPGALTDVVRTFSLTVTDNSGATSTADTVNITTLLAPERIMIGGVLVPARISIA